ncbi:hypothetical protein CQW23_24541 [Capsicum baccatum]|uniref:GED domain-containing protein n=1 Tax=Capsicum baccatum TaxID=33114 RepID=A0A2G2VV53_CAPBA|nr:hypothetical protein CQW23_24541 [Capsicum baccatum]
MRLQNNPKFRNAPHICLEYNGKSSGHPLERLNHSKGLYLWHGIDTIPAGVTARKNEARLFTAHPLLSKIDKFMVGIPVLAQKLVSIQATIISKSLPEFEGKISDKLAAHLDELNRLPQHLSSVTEALTTFMCIRDSMGRVWDYIEKIVTEVLMHHCENYPQLQSSTRRASQNLIAKKKNESVDWVKEITVTEKQCNPGYLATYNKLMGQQQALIEIMNDPEKGSVGNLKGLGEVDIGLGVVQQAFELKMRIVAYWKIVLMRLVDLMALHIMFSIQNMINKDMEQERVQEMMAPQSGGIERYLMNRRSLQRHAVG